MNRENLANGLLASPVSTGATSATLQSGYGDTMPEVPFKLTVTPFGQLSTRGNSEIWLVTARSGEVLTITRAQDGTTAKSFIAGDIVSNGVYIEDIDEMVPKGSLTFNVRDYGAVADGTTDDTAAVQAALDAAAVSGGIVFFPAGNYSVNPVFAAQGVSIQGASNANTIVKRRDAATSNPSNSVGAINFHGTSTTPLQRFFIRDITADGNRSGITLGTGSLVDNEAFSFIYCRNFFVENCRGINAPGEGFDLDYCFNGTLMGCVANENGGNGFHASLESMRLKFIGNYAWGNGIVYNRAGFDQYTSAVECIYIGNVSDSNVYRNYNIEGSGAVLVGNKSVGAPSQPDVFDGAVGSGIIATTRTNGTIKKDAVVLLSGWSYVIGNGAKTMNHTLIIPEDVDEILSLSVSYIAGRQTAAGAPSVIEDFVEQINSNYGTIGVSSISKTAKTATVTMDRLTGSTWATNYYYGYSWIAIARKKQ